MWSNNIEGNIIPNIIGTPIEEIPINNELYNSSWESFFPKVKNLTHSNIKIGNAKVSIIENKYIANKINKRIFDINS